MVSATQTQSCALPCQRGAAGKEWSRCFGPFVKNMALCALRCIFARTLYVSMVRSMKGITQNFAANDRPYRKSGWKWTRYDGFKKKKKKIEWKKKEIARHTQCEPQIWVWRKLGDPLTREKKCVHKSLLCITLKTQFSDFFFTFLRVSNPWCLDITWTCRN